MVSLGANRGRSGYLKRHPLRSGRAGGGRGWGVGRITIAGALEFIAFWLSLPAAGCF